MNFTFGDSLAE